MDVLALNKFSYGLYIAGGKRGDQLTGCVVDALMQTTVTPPTLVMCSIKNNLSNEIFTQTGAFSISVLPADVNPFVIANFGFQSGRDVDKWANVPYTMHEGLPLLDGCVAYVTCKITETRDMNTHTLLFCDVTDAWQLDGRPLIYGNYRETMRADTMKSFQEYKKTGKSPMLG